MRRGQLMMAVAVSIAALLVVGGVIGVVVHDQQRADAGRQRALADLSMALKNYEALDASLRAAEPKFGQEMVAFSTTKLADYGNLYLAVDQDVPQAEGPVVNDYLTLRRDLSSFKSVSGPIWVREADGKTVVLRLDAAIDGYRQAQSAAVELTYQYHFLSDIALVFVNLKDPALNGSPGAAINNASQLRLTLSAIRQDMTATHVSPMFTEYVKDLDSLVADYGDFATSFQNGNQAAATSALQRLSADVEKLLTFDWVGASHYVDGAFATELKNFETDLATAKGE
jgi:hypothetical protein